MSSKLLVQQFMEQSPVTVMVRSTLQHALSPENLDAIFAETAVRQRPGELLFSSAVDLLAMVVWRQRDSIGQAYRYAQEDFEVSVRSIYNKLNGTEPQVCRELVRRTAESLEKVVDMLRPGRKPQLAGYRTRIIDGNHLAATDHRLGVLRRTNSGPLPGQVLAVLDPDRMLIVDLFPCEDGHAQERRLLPEVVESARDGQWWIADRNFCTTGFLFGLDGQQARFITRQHASTLTWEEETKSQKIGRCETGVVYQQTVRAFAGPQSRLWRRIRIKLDKPTQDGEQEIHLLTNLPPRDANAYQVAELYLKRWTIENAFQELEQSLRSEINTLAYPGAALLGFAIAAITYNALSLAKWAIEKEHAETITREQLSGYYLAAIVSQDYGGMMIALPPKVWAKRFGQMTARQLANHLRACAIHVRPDAFKKNIRRPKRKQPKRSSGKFNHHVSTAKLLAAAK
jgi:IS4 transposase